MIYEQEETEAEEGADFIGVYRPIKTEAEEGAVSYTTLTRNKMDSLILKDKKGGEYNVVNSTQKSEYLSATHKERLPYSLEEGLVFTPSRKEGMYFNETLMLKYAQYLSSKIEKVCLDKLNEIRRFEQLPAEKQVDIYIDKAIEKEATITPPHQTPEQRVDQKVHTKYINSVIDSMIKHVPKEKRYEFYRALGMGLNEGLFGHSATRIRAIIETTKSASVRDFMSAQCLSLITATEKRIEFYLQSMRAANIQLTLEKFEWCVEQAVEGTRPLLFVFQQEIDFLLNEKKDEKIEVSLHSDYKITKQVTSLKQLT
jgi:hypothetical protein